MAQRRILKTCHVFLAVCIAAFQILTMAGWAMGGTPHPRVISLNVCTDQLVLALANPEQIVSLSNLAGDSNLSFMHDKAAAYPNNGGLAEDVFTAPVDVVVTASYSLHNTAGTLKSLGIQVEEFDYSQTLDTIPRDIRRMGSILHQEERAEAMANAFDRELDTIKASRPENWPSMVVFEQNSIVLGAATLVDSVLTAAGFRNLAAEQGYVGMVPYPLELLVHDKPDLILISRPYNGAPALADQIEHHRAIVALGNALGGNIVPQGSWACGGPFTIEAVRALARLRSELAIPGMPHQ